MALARPIARHRDRGGCGSRSRRRGGGAPRRRRIVERRPADAEALEAELADAGAAEGRAASRARARPRAPAMPRPQCARRARRRSCRCSPASAPSSPPCVRPAPTPICSTCSWPRAGPPFRARASSASTRAMRDLAARAVARRAPRRADARNAGAASSWPATTAGRSGTRSRSASPTPSLPRSRRTLVGRQRLTSSDFVYGNTRLHARRAALLDADDYERAARRATSMASSLRSSRPRTRLSSSDAADQTGLRASTRRSELTSAARLRRCAASMPIGPASSSTCMLSRFDVENVVLMLRARAGTQRPADEALGALLPVGWLVEPLAGEILRGPELAGAVDLIVRRTPVTRAGRRTACGARRVRTHEETSRRSSKQSSRAHAAHVTATLASAGRDARTLLRFARRAIDERNLLVALRLRDAPDVGSSRSTWRRRVRCFLAGSVALARFAAAVRAPAPAAVDRRARRRIAGSGWQAPLERWAVERRPPALERDLERRRIADAAALFRWATRSRSTCRSRSPPQSGPRRGTCASSARRARAASIPRSVRARAPLAGGGRMSRLLVLTTRELAAGYRLAGAAALEVGLARGGRGSARGAGGARGRRDRRPRPLLPRARAAAAAAARPLSTSRSWWRFPPGRRSSRPRIAASSCCRCSARPSATRSHSVRKAARQ